MVFALPRLGMATLAVWVQSAMSVNCDWQGFLQLGSVVGDTNYCLGCFGSRLFYIDRNCAKVSSAETESSSPLSLMGGSSAGLPVCSWTGDSPFSGKHDCDDFVFGCYGDQLRSTTFVGHSSATATECAGLYDCPQTADGSVVACNFNQPLTLTGKNGERFVLSCIDGALQSVYANYAALPPHQAVAVAAAAPPLAAAASAGTGSSQCLSWATAVGSWQEVTESNQPFQVEVSYGTTSSDSESLTSTWAQTLTTSMEAGITFEGLSEKVSITSTVSTEIARQMSSTLTQSYGVKYTYGCDRGQLWQWVVKNGRPWESESNWGTVVASKIFWCTLDAYEAPKCPPSACDCSGDETCATSDCQTCQPYEGSSAEVLSFNPPKCDWTGKQLLAGVHSSDDFYLSCEGNVMTGIEAADLLLAGESSCSACNWVGVRMMAGLGSDDDLYLECCGSSQSIVGISARDGYAAHKPGNPKSGIPCQWTGSRRANSAGSGHDFLFDCEGGLLVEVNFIPSISVAV